MRILVLGGTAAARDLADTLVSHGDEVMTSLAGRTTNAKLPEGMVRVGGFGGASGLARFLADNGVDAVINATHPFAAQMSANAAHAADETGVPLLRLSRPSWRERADARAWTWVGSHDAAARAAARRPGVVWLTVGRQHSLDYVPALGARRVVCRVVRALAEVPPPWRQIVATGPFDHDGEAELVARERVAVLVTKDSGGAETSAKLDVAREHDLGVIMIARPDAECGEAVTTQEEAVAWLRSISLRQRRRR